MLKPAEACVLHVADAADQDALETVCRTTQVIASVGLHQVLLVFAPSDDADLIWSAAVAAEVRPLRFFGASMLAKVKALQSEFSRAAGERALHAVHLHGVAPCLLGLRALHGHPLPQRVLYSPHFSGASPWMTALFRRLLQRYLGWMDCAAMTASLAEAQTLSRLLGRSAELLPHPVSEAFFEVQRQESRRAVVFADGFGAEAVNLVTRMSVLLNGRGTRVPISWLGTAEPRARAQLEAANVQVLVVPEDAERAQLLAGAWAFIHVAPGERSPLAAAQAMAAGVPCLVPDTPAHRALVRHGETGFICASERDFLEKLIFLLRERGEARRIGQAARADAERCFTLRHFERAVLRAYGFSPTGDFQPADSDGPLRSVYLS